VALDTYKEVWNRVLLRCPAVSPKLSEDWVKNAFRQVAERRRWSWLIRYGQFIAPPLNNQGRASVTTGFTTVTGTGTNWDASLVGRQFRTSTASPFYTITQVTSPTSLELDSVWGDQSFTNQPVEIYQCFFTPPNDFHALITLWDPRMNWQLWRHIQQVELNTYDAQRSTRGQAFVVAHRDYTRSQVGVVSQPIHTHGFGAVPYSGGTYNAPADAIFNILITVSGVSGTAVFLWNKNDGPYTTVQTDVDGGRQYLQDGVQIAFPPGATYVVGDTFVIRATAISNAGLPRYELWPHQTAAYVYPFLYEARAPDISDMGIVIPRYIRGDVLLEMALSQAASWPGPSADKPNPYFNPRLSDTHSLKAERMLLELERQDDEVYEQDMMFQRPLGFPYATPLGDSAWLQSHAV